MIHLHSATENRIGQLLHSEEQPIQLPSTCPEGAPFEFNVPLSADTRQRVTDTEFLLLTMMGHVRAGRSEDEF